MEWSDVRIFLAVVRGGSFGEAARTLGVSHPTVGRRIKALEDEAEQALFRRTADGLVLTDAGDTVLALAESMENSALAMERRLAGNHDRLEGMLRISSAEWFAGYVLAPVLAELTRRHPAVVPEVIASYRLLDLSRREADVAFRLVPFSEPDIVQRRLMSMAYGVYGSADTASALQADPASVGLVLMNTAQSHFPDVAWLLDRFPLSRPSRQRCACKAWALQCCRGRLAMRYLACSASTCRTNPRAGISGWGTITTCGIWIACGRCWISPLRCCRIPRAQRHDRIVLLTAGTISDCAEPSR